MLLLIFCNFCLKLPYINRYGKYKLALLKARHRSLIDALKKQMRQKKHLIKRNHGDFPAKTSSHIVQPANLLTTTITSQELQSLIFSYFWVLRLLILLAAAADIAANGNALFLFSIFSIFPLFFYLFASCQKASHQFSQKIMHYSRKSIVRGLLPFQ